MAKRTDVPSWVTLTPDEQLMWSNHPSLWSVWRLLGIGLILIGLGISGAIFLDDILRLVSLASVVGGLLIVGITYFSNRSVSTSSQ